MANGATKVNNSTRLNLMATKILEMNIIAVYMQATGNTLGSFKRKFKMHAITSVSIFYYIIIDELLLVEASNSTAQHCVWLF